ncbi:9486_t:CDS:2, partial [Racocetra fulgida]
MRKKYEMTMAQQYVSRAGIPFADDPCDLEDVLIQIVLTVVMLNIMEKFINTAEGHVLTNVLHLESDNNDYH